MTFKHGIYKHFKGHTYKTLFLAKNSETLEEMVVYANTENPSDIWVRPLRMFIETIEREGKQIKRFEFIEIKRTWLSKKGGH